MKLSLGIIGFGRIGAEHAAWINESRGVRAVAAADPTPARRAAAAARGMRTCDDIASLLCDPAIDAVLIATPTAMHFEQASAALAAGKHVMVEKPMALDYQQSAQLIEQAAKTSRVISVFHNRRWDPDYLAVRAIAAAGTLGKLINVESRIGQFASCVGPAAKEYRPAWRTEAAFGGGALYDWGSHLTDQLWRLLWPARPLRLFAQLRSTVWSRDCDDFARLLIDFDNGATGLIEANTTTANALPRWQLDGSAGTISGPLNSGWDMSLWSQLRFTPAPGNSAPRHLPRAEPGFSETQIWEHFAAAVGGKGPPAVSARSVLPTMQLMDAARRSSREGVAVPIDASAWELD